MYRYKSGLSFEPTAAELKIFSVFDVSPAAEEPEQVIQHLMSFRNERRLFRRKCDFSGAEILSAYPSGTPFPVYRNDHWWGDGWDPHSYAERLDLSKPFFPQFKQLQERVPREGTSVFSCENCDYNGHIRESKNCYMNALIYKCEDTHYSYWMVADRDVMDCWMVNNSTLAYECVDCDNLFECVYSQECFNCQNCYFSYQLRSCQHCIGCANLTNASYHISNQPVSPEEFERVRAALLNGSRDGFEKGVGFFRDMLTLALHRCTHNLRCEQVVGDHCFNSKNCVMAFDGYGGEDVNHSVSFGAAKDALLCYSVGWPTCELVYKSAVTRGSTNIAFCYYTYFSNDLRYCDSMNQCDSCFGCVGLRRAKNCILNQAYSKHEYDTLRVKLVAAMRESGEWGHFFPKTLSTFGYNNTAAQDYFPLARADALNAGWRWHDQPDTPPRAGLESPPAVLTPTTPDMSSKAFVCQESGKPYKVVRQELDFLLKMHLPIPSFGPDARHNNRFNRRNRHQLFSRTCAIDGSTIYSSFNPTSSYKICCEEEYRRLVY